MKVLPFVILPFATEYVQTCLSSMVNWGVQNEFIYVIMIRGYDLNLCRMLYKILQSILLVNLLATL
jgi:hypothetical protein